MQVNVDGTVSFDSGIEYMPEMSNLSALEVPIVAPFWSNVDTREHGMVYYRYENTTINN